MKTNKNVPKDVDAKDGQPLNEGHQDNTNIKGYQPERGTSAGYQPGEVPSPEGSNPPTVEDTISSGDSDG